MDERSDRWEWVLPDGRRVSARLDPSRGREIVHLGDRVAAEGERGAAVEGHVLDGAPDVIVTFEPYAPVCVLRVDGHEIAPVTWPGRGRARKGDDDAREGVPLRVLGIAAVTLAALGLVGVLATAVSRAWGGSGSDGARTNHRDPAGLFVARFPDAFKARPVAAGGATSAVLAERAAADETIVVLASRLGPDEPRDPWRVQKSLLPEALAALPRATPAFDEIGRSDEPCLGGRGAVVVGRITTARGAGAKLWSCAVADENAAYLVAFTLPDGSPLGREKELRAVLDATDRTNLGPAPP